MEQDLNSRADEYIDKLLNKCPQTNDGVTIFLGDEIWFEQNGYDDWPFQQPTKGIVNALYLGLGFKEYKGNFTVGTKDWEGGNLECYAWEKNCPTHEL